MQSKGQGTVFTSEYCTGGQTVVGTPHSVTPGPYILWSFLKVPGIWKTYIDGTMQQIGARVR